MMLITLELVDLVTSRIMMIRFQTSTKMTQSFTVLLRLHYKISIVLLLLKSHNILRLQRKTLASRSIVQ